MARGFFEDVLAVAMLHSPGVEVKGRSSAVRQAPCRDRTILASAPSARELPSARALRLGHRPCSRSRPPSHRSRIADRRCASAKSLLKSRPRKQVRPRPPLAMWGGLECTVNRVGDAFFTQLDRSGHLRRDDDLERFAALGITRVALPGPVGSDGPRRASLPRTGPGPTERLAELRRLGITPIVGLVHHGSGPRHTQSARRQLRRRPGRIRRRGRGALPVGRSLDARQRAADHGALQRPVRPLVPARLRRPLVRRGPLQPVPRHRPVDGGDPARQPSRLGWSRPTTSAAPMAPRRWPMWSISTTSGAGSPGTCCAAWSPRITRCGLT